MKTINSQSSSATWTSEDFERWLALQSAIGLSVVNPESVAKIRSELKNGATMTPMTKTLAPIVS